jgi:dTDP-4-dehydrorhamnose reductase
VHLAPEGECNWFEFASAIFEVCGVSPALTATTAAEFGGPVRRPAYSVLGSRAGVPALPPWRAGLERYLREKGHVSA